MSIMLLKCSFHIYPQSEPLTYECVLGFRSSANEYDVSQTSSKRKTSAIDDLHSHHQMPGRSISASTLPVSAMSGKEKVKAVSVFS